MLFSFLEFCGCVFYFLLECAFIIVLFGGKVGMIIFILKMRRVVVSGFKSRLFFGIFIFSVFVWYFIFF